MLAGVGESDHARSHAAELLERRRPTPAPGRGRPALMRRADARVRDDARRRPPRSSAPRGVDRRTKDLVKRLEPGEIAVIDHEDLDRVAADGLVEAGVAAVVNAAPSISGRYPNGGPIRRRRARASRSSTTSGRDLLDRRPRRRRRCASSTARSGAATSCSPRGSVRDADEIEAAMEAARASIGVELERFAENTLEYVRREARLTFEPLELPPLAHRVRGPARARRRARPRLPQDLAALRPYIREYRPVLIGVDGGADALLEIGLQARHHHRRLRLGVGARARAPRRTSCTTCTPTGARPGREKLLEWGVDYHEFVAEGTSEDVAMLLAYEAGAQLIVAVGTHATMVEFLDKGRQGMASTFLTRLRLGPVLVDAKGVSRLYEGRVRRLDWCPARRLGARGDRRRRAIVSEPDPDGPRRRLRSTLRDLWFSITG